MTSRVDYDDDALNRSLDTFHHAYLRFYLDFIHQFTQDDEGNVVILTPGDSALKEKNMHLEYFKCTVNDIHGGSW